MSRSWIGLLALAGIALVPATLVALEDAARAEIVETTEVSTEDPLSDGMMPPGWSHVGCIQIAGECRDVFSDGTSLWVCKACGTTTNPNSKKCRRLTQYEIDNSLWCS